MSRTDVAIQVRELPPGKKLGDFLDVPRLLYAGDPGFVVPLDMEQRDKLTKGKNPFFDHAEVCLFMAYRDGKPAGRISAQIDREHLSRYGDGCGFYGYFDCIDDDRVARALVDAAANWLRLRNLSVMRGPFSLSINEELGTMVEGQTEPSMFMTPYHRGAQDRLSQAAGLRPLKDLLSWHYRIGDVPKRAQRAHREVLALPEVRIRNTSLKHLKRDVGILMDVYNDAWHDNFHFVPMTEAELAKMAQDMKLLLDEQIALIAEIDGEPAAIAVALPNLNEAIFDLDGKLLPFGLPKLVYRLKVSRPRSARLILLGIKQAFRKQRRYGGLSTALYVEIARRATRMGYEWAELGWTDEDNHPVNLGIKMMGGVVHKRHRLYEMPL